MPPNANENGCQLSLFLTEQTNTSEFCRGWILQKSFNGISNSCWLDDLTISMDGNLCIHKPVPKNI